MDDIAGLASVRTAPARPGGMFLKRGFDLVAGLALAFLLAPLMLVIALAVRLSSGGNPFFVQQRHGLGNRIIRVIKFRTMTVSESGATARQAIKNDSRITPLGHVLRRTSLDELPQLFNVIKGEMSLVGPRPHPVWLNEDHAAMVFLDRQHDRLVRYDSRHAVRPGMTGWAQVNGYRGETDTREKMARRVACDLYYIDNWTFRLDLRILRKTVPAVLKGENAR